MIDSNSAIGALRRRTAKRLRDNATDAENLLWRRLRRFPISSTHFRRVVATGPYVADFACVAARLIIEVDGSQRGRGDLCKRDERRTRRLEAEGYRVWRFWNNDLTRDMDGALEAICAAHLRTVGRACSFEASTPKTRRRCHPTPARFARRPSRCSGGDEGKSPP